MAQIGVTLILRLACVTFAPFRTLKSAMNTKNSRYKVDPYDVLNNVINLLIQILRMLIEHGYIAITKCYAGFKHQQRLGQESP